MKKLTSFIPRGIATAALLAPLAVLAQGPQDGFGVVGKTIGVLLAFLNDYVVPLIFALSFIFFLWGLFTYFIRGGATDEGQEKGKALMLWGIIGMVVMVSIWGIVNLLASSLGFSGASLQNVPTVPGGGSGGSGSTQMVGNGGELCNGGSCAN